jgi:predicted ribonuclease YlaK
MTTARRYPGSRPFQDNDLDRLLFWGREQEKSTLLHLILAEDLVLLYAKSGMGKTSLLSAGILQQLRVKEYFPVLLRLNDP